jgi:hypothetical protein
MGSAADREAPPEPGGGDISAAFLPAHDLPDILDLGYVLTPPLITLPDGI